MAANILLLTAYLLQIGLSLKEFPLLWQREEFEEGSVFDTNESEALLEQLTAKLLPLKQEI